MTLPSDLGRHAVSVTTEHAQDDTAHPSLIELPGLEVGTSTDPAQGSDLTVVTAVRERPRWTLTEAAERVGVSRSTLRRRLEAGAFPQAKQVGEGDNPPWTVTVEDLLGAGFTLARSVANQDAPTERAQTKTEPAPEHVQQLSARVSELERELAQERSRREVEQVQRTAAEALANEREQHVQSLRQALRMLEARPAPTQPAPHTRETGVESPEQPGGAEGPEVDSNASSAAVHPQPGAPAVVADPSPRAPQRSGFLGRLLGRR